MNNYCTNCGKKLNEDELACKNCNTPIIDLPYNYQVPPTKKKKIKDMLLLIIGLIFICILAVTSIRYYSSSFAKNFEIDTLQKKYVESYVKSQFNAGDFDIEYHSSGSCIISGDCTFDIVRGCDGGSCQEYQYDDDCTSYYFLVKIGDKEHTVTVFKKNGDYSVAEGKKFEN